MKLFTSFLMLFAAGLSAVQAQSRLIGSSNYIYNNPGFYISDSTAYTYTGSNGGDLTHTQKFTTKNVYDYNTVKKSYFNYSLTQQGFDINDNVTSLVNQLYDTSTAQWINSTEFFNTFDSNNHDTLEVSESWDKVKAKWFITGAIHPTWTGNNITKEVYQKYDTSKGAYYNFLLYLSTFNSGNFELTSATQEWDAVKLKYFNTNMITWYYDAMNNDTVEIFQIYDTTKKQWNNVSKYYNVFNTDNTLKTSNVLSWNLTKWDSSSRNEYYYDAGKNDTSVIDQFYISNKWQNANKSIYKYNSDNQATYFEELSGTSSFTPDFEEFYYYQPYVSGLSQLTIDNGQLTIYPNPSRDIINVMAILPGEQPVQLRLYNSLGQQAWSLDMSKAKRIECMVPVNNLTNGVYILNIVQGSYVQSKQVVVEK